MERDARFDAQVNNPRSIAIIHPDLGIGGAERLIVDMALGLQELNHKVIIYTSHCDKSHAFEEVANGKLKVVVYGDFLPRKIAGKFTIVCATIRQIYLILKLLWLTKSAYDFYVIDSLASCLPIIWLYNILLKSSNDFSRILFYCHFPDLRLASKDGGALKKLYRIPFDIYEEFCFLFPNKIYVNSNFTKSMFAESFQLLSNQSFKPFVAPSVAYPCIDETIHNNPEVDRIIESLFRLNNNCKFFLSINRFEKKKNIDLAIKSFYKLILSSSSNASNVKLVIAGGYDNLVSENVEYLKELSSLSKSLGLTFKVFLRFQDFVNLDPTSSGFEDHQIFFLPNISTDLRNSLMKYTELLLYTPSFEHFGIVPIEAMKYNTLVLAVNNGGPKESIKPLDDDIEGLKTESIEITNPEGTGFLKPNDEDIWYKVLAKVLSLTSEQKAQLGKNGEVIVEKLFTRKVLRETVNLDIVKLSKNQAKLEFQQTQRTIYFFLVLLMFPIVLSAVLFLLYYKRF